MRIIVGIDVSKQTSQVAITADHEVRAQFKITNDLIGFTELKSKINQYSGQIEVVFEATGVYSHRLRTFLVNNGYSFSQLNPLSAKKEMDRLRPNKNDVNDALNLADSQYVLSRPATLEQDEVYKELMRESRYYQQCVADLVKLKNQLHKALQDTFPEIEQIFSNTDGTQYWKMVEQFPHAEIVLTHSLHELSDIIQRKGNYHMSEKRANQVGRKLFELASRSYPAVPAESHMVYQVQTLSRRLSQNKDEQ
ncbi:IS110 family transposase, partial [Secundilactobacillus yichangensis]|uniref:IS110 family transposase n=1 Tax=Secundilactobacillus yichangensis TaxID=2799580 RepID=UPI0019419D2C